MKPSIAGHCTAQTGSFACLFGYSLLARPLRLGSQRVGSPCSVVFLIGGVIVIKGRYGQAISAPTGPCYLTTILVPLVTYSLSLICQTDIHLLLGGMSVICGAVYPFSYSIHHPCGATRFNGHTGILH